MNLNLSKKLFLWMAVIPPLVLVAFCGVRLHDLSLQRTHIKEVYGQLNSFTYGILSADAWKEIMRTIVTKRVAEFQLTEEQQKVLETETAKVLDRLLVEAEKLTRKPNNGLGAIKTHFAQSYIKTARKNVSKFAGTINHQLQDPKTMKKIKELALAQFDAFAATTHSSAESQETLNRLLAENDAASVPEFNDAAHRRIAALDTASRDTAATILVFMLLFMLGWRVVLKHPELHRPFFAASVALALGVLLTSLSIPMMEIDARLKSVDLMLIGERVRFDEQVIYYRSKSLMQVVRLLLQSGKWDSMGVAALLVTFSVLFPVAKLVTALLYLRGNQRFNHSKFVQFFAFKSGKWSMADVTVVAIFMSYIGFQSILNTQLPKLNMKTDLVESITTNASSMQAGFVLFTAFVLYSMGLSEILKRITRQQKAVQPQRAQRDTAEAASPVLTY